MPFSYKTYTLILVVGFLGIAIIVGSPLIAGGVSPGTWYADYAFFAARKMALMVNLLMLSLMLLVIDRTVGLHAGFFLEFNDIWRRAPGLLKFLVTLLGLLALLTNLDFFITYVLNFFQIPGEAPIFYQEKIHYHLSRFVVFSPVTMNAVFLTILGFAVVMGYRRLPIWRQSWGQDLGEDTTYVGSISVLRDPKKRQKLKRADSLLEKGNLLKAAKLFDSLGEECAYRAGKLFRDKGRDKAAAKSFLKAGDYYFSKGNYLRAGDAYYFGHFWEKASNVYANFKPTEVLLADRDRVRMWIGRWGECLFMLGRYRDAAELYENHQMFNRAGEAYEKAGMAKEAADAYNKVGAFDSSFKALRDSGQQALAEIEKAKLLVQKGDLTQAALIFEQAGKYTLAAETYRKAEMPIKAAKCYLKDGNHAVAAELFLTGGREEGALLCYQEMGDFAKAAQLAAHLGYRDKQAIYLEKAGQYIAAARSYLMIGDVDKAVSALRRVSFEGPQDVAECEQILVILLEQDRNREALACAYGMLDGKTPTAVLAPLLYSLAKIHDRMSQSGKAASMAIKAAKLAGDNRDYIMYAKKMARAIGMNFSPKLLSDQEAPRSAGPIPAPPVRQVKMMANNPETQHVQVKPETKASQLQDHLAKLETTRTLDDFSVYDITHDGPLTRYQILREIGRGGMGRVYKALDRKLKRKVALKMLHPELNQEPQILLFFRREARAVAALNHANIVNLYDAGMQKGCFYMIMEFVDGLTLDKLHLKHPEVVKRWFLWIWLEVCKGLKFAHEEGILHRDIKPTNIMVTKNRSVKILDFGLAKQMKDSSMTHQGWGTPAFMAPELFYGERSTVASDIYALGATFYLLASGRAPYFGEDPAKKFVADGLPMAPNQLEPSLSPDISEIILKCLYLQPNLRYRSIDLLVNDLRKAGKQK